MTTILQDAVNALSLGGLYALFSLGVALIFGVARIVNFAYGELLTVAGYMIVLTAALAWPLVIAIAVLSVVVVALLMERIAFRPLRQAPATTLLIVSFALSVLVQNIVLLIAGARAKTTSFGSSLVETISLGNVQIARVDLLTILVTLALIGALTLTLRRTSIGIQIRAAAEDFGMARLVGVRANVVIASAFAMSAVLAAAAGILLTIKIATLTPDFGVQPVTVAFVATVVGGMGSLPGAAIGGFLIGALTVVLQVTLPASLVPYRDAFVFGLVIAMLLFRPQGLMPVATGERV